MLPPMRSRPARRGSCSGPLNGAEALSVHSRASGNPVLFFSWLWIPAFAGTSGTRSARALLRPFQAELPDQRAPLLLFGAAVGAQALDRRRVERDQPDRFDFLLDLGIGERALHLGVQPV